MGGAMIKFGSVTYAIRAQKLLEQNGIRSNIRKVTAGQRSGGCGYGLDVDAKNIERAKQLLWSAGIRPVEVVG